MTTEENKNEEKGNNKAVSSEQPQENIPESLDDILKKVDPKQLALVDKFVPGLIQYLKVQEAKINFIGENALSKEWLQNETAKLQKQTQAIQPQPQATAQPQTGLSGLLGSVPAPLLMKALGMGGGGDDEELKALMRENLKQTLDSNRRKADWTDQFMGTIVQGIAAGFGNKIVKNASDAMNLNV